jgi:hypothetical protein
MDDSKLQEGFRNLYSVLNIFRKAKKDYWETLIYELNKIDKKEIERQYQFYNAKENKEKIVLTRFKILWMLLKGSISTIDIENIKSEIRGSYDNDIYRNWGNFGILYSIFNFYHEKEVADFLGNLNQSLIRDLDLVWKAKFHMVDFNWAQNNWFDNFWTAIYNTSHKQQKTAIHLYISSFSWKGNTLNNLENEVQIWLWKWDENIDEIDFEYIIVPINELSYEKILSEFEKHKTKILDNSSMQEPKTGNKSYWIYTPWNDASKWEEYYNTWYMWIGWDALGDLKQYNSKIEIGEKNKELFNLERTKTNDALACWQFVSEMKVGDIIIPKKWNKTYLGYWIVESPYMFDDSRESYKSIRKVKWIKKWEWQEDGGDIVAKSLTNISKYLDYVNKLILLLGIESPSHINNTPMITTNSLNTILYGVPWTGKTYNTVNYALSIIEEKPISELQNESKTEEGRREVNRRYNDYKELWQIVFTTFHQSFWYEEFIEGLRAHTDDTGNIAYAIENGIFKNIAKKATENLLLATHPTQVRKDFHEVLNEVLKEVNEGKILEIKMVQTSFKIYDYNDRNIFFEKASWGRNHNLSMKTLERMYNNRDTAIIWWLSVYYVPLLKLCLEKEGKTTSPLQEWQIISSDRAEYSIVKIGNEIIEIQSTKEGNDRWRILIPREIVELLAERIRNNEMTLEDIKNKPLEWIDTYIQGYRSELKAIVKAQLHTTKVIAEKKKNYVLIIDEINRWNISKIFWELITLIEDSKRIWNPEETSVILPNSQEAFGVPNNLYILWTMNTADRSIALMDIALRRRFTFKEIQPDSSLLEWILVWTIDIEKMFVTLNKRIEYLFDRDHVIWHSFFLPLIQNPSVDKLNQIFENSIIPLLQEYFYEDWEKIQIIFGDHKEQRLKQEWDRIIRSEVTSEMEALWFNHDDIIDEKSTFSINEQPNENSYVWIYQRSYE